MFFLLSTKEPTELYGTPSKICLNEMDKNFKLDELIKQNEHRIILSKFSSLSTFGCVHLKFQLLLQLE